MVFLTRSRDAFQILVKGRAH